MLKDDKNFWSLDDKCALIDLVTSPEPSDMGRMERCRLFADEIGRSRRSVVAQLYRLIEEYRLLEELDALP